MFIHSESFQSDFCPQSFQSFTRLIKKGGGAFLLYQNVIKQV